MKIKRRECKQNMASYLKKKLLIQSNLNLIKRKLKN